MTREQLAAELDRAGLTAPQKALALALADDYAAGLVDEYARSPVSQGGTRKGAAA